jgi:hypothetical protein
MTFESCGVRLTYKFFKSTAAKLIAYLHWEPCTLSRKWKDFTDFKQTDTFRHSQGVIRQDSDEIITSWPKEEAADVDDSGSPEEAPPADLESTRKHAWLEHTGWLLLSLSLIDKQHLQQS